MTEHQRLWVYILRCSDGSYLVGSTPDDPEAPAQEHNARLVPATRSRLPVRLLYAEVYDSLAEAVAREELLRSWPAARLEAVMAGNWDGVVS